MWCFAHAEQSTGSKSSAQKLVVQALDATVGVLAGFVIFNFIGGMGASNAAIFQYLLLALVLNHGALRLSGVYQRVLRYGLSDTLKLLVVALTVATVFIAITGSAFLSDVSAQLIILSQLGVVIAISLMRIVLVSLLRANLRTGPPTAIYGAGQAGRILQSVLEIEQNSIRYVMSTMIQKSRIHISMG